MKPVQHHCESPTPGCHCNEQEWPGVAAALDGLGLTTIAGVKSYRGNVIKNHKGSRDVLRIPVTGINGRALTLYLKRTWKSYKKDGLLSLLQHGKVWSISRREWENSKTLRAAGLRTATPIAFGEECGPLWEKFSYILTAEATGTQTLGRFLQTCHDPARRRRVLDALALEIRRMHAAGLASPDLFARHIFVDDAPDVPTFCLIDMARLDRRQSPSRTLRARDLAALNITAPLRHASARERLRFLKRYADHNARSLLPLIRVRVNHLLRRRKFRDYSLPDESKKKPAPGLNTSPRKTTPEMESTHTRSQP